MDEDDDYVEEHRSPAPSDTSYEVDHSVLQHIARDGILQLSLTKRKGTLDRHTTKWLRLKRYYNDQYLELLNTTHIQGNNDEALEDSQLGSVHWTGAEKSILFEALQRKGRRDIAGLATAVQTKSEVEIMDYLNRLTDSECERQMFARRSKNFSHVEIEAAVEIGEERETMLENAADALAAYQACYDQVSAHHQTSDISLVDSDIAEALDSLYDSAEAGQLDDEQDEIQFRDHPEYELFHLSTFLDLSRRLFMNMPPGGKHAHWMELAEANECPSIASDAVDMFYKLTKSLVSRVVQTAIFLAKSRIRAIDATDQNPAHVLKEADIEAALDVLNMQPHGFDYWAGWVKRSKVQVVSGIKTRGQSDRKILSMQQIEDVLSIRATRGRSRSLSSLVSMTSTDASTIDEDETEPQSPRVSEEETHQNSSDADPSSSAETMGESMNYDSEQDSEGENLDMQNGLAESDSDFDSDTASKVGKHRHMSRKRRLEMVENEEDEYMERLDQASRHREEAYLYQTLGQPKIKAESPESSDQHTSIPRKRRTEEDLKDWSNIPYCAPWEHTTVSEPSIDESSKS